MQVIKRDGTLEDYNGSKIEKAVEVKSTLRPVLKIRPRAAVWKTYVTFAAQANHQVLSYERDF